MSYSSVHSHYFIGENYLAGHIPHLNCNFGTVQWSELTLYSECTVIRVRENADILVVYRNFLYADITVVNNSNVGLTAGGEGIGNEYAAMCDTRNQPGY